MVGWKDEEVYVKRLFQDTILILPERTKKNQEIPQARQSNSRY
jgi:hypothetical protein